jgi:hypothetical protein
MSEGPEAEHTRHASLRRVQIGYALVALLAIGVAITAWILLSRPEPFSDWAPEAKGKPVANQIAAHVAERYRADSGKQLLEVSPALFAYGDAPIVAVGLGDEASQRVAQLDKTSIRTTQLYFLCGPAPRCALHEGRMTARELQAVEGAALEVALSALHHQPQLRSVLVALPASLEKPPPLGLYIRRANVASLLEEPLSKTLAWSEPPLPRDLTDEQRRKVDDLALPLTFRLAFTPPESGPVRLVLFPLSAQ